jgi:hypothetical protein
MTRFILEGTWTGYVSRQSRVVHREVLTAKRAVNLKGLHKIVYTDGTALLLSLRAAQPREKIVVINSYGEMIRDAERYGGNVVKVADICDAAERKASQHALQERGTP